MYSESAQADSVSENDPVSKKLWEIHRRLTAEYGSLISFLNYGAPFELLIGVILSAQTTDIQVNAVTPKLFARFPDAAALAAAPRSEVEEIIKSTGFYRSKAAHIQGAAVALVRKYHGEVPQSMSELTSLPGVGRKSANVVRSHVFGLPAIIVDTHFGRVMRRLGIGRAKNADALERELLTIIPHELQTPLSMLVNKHGRVLCQARSPRCSACVLMNLCDYANRELEPPA